MAALEWFEGIPTIRRKVEELAMAIESAHAAAGPHGQSMGTIGGGSGRDSLAGIDRLIDSDVRLELRHAKATLAYRTAYAMWVLYGMSGRGGLAMAKGVADADILCCHYIQGMKWSDIAREVVRPDTDYPSQWCRRRAITACRYIDRVGMPTLVDT